MNIPSIFSQSSLLTPKSFKEELTNLYNAVSVGRETMDKLWILYWIVANLVQDDPIHELCNRLMVKGYLDQDETSKLNLALVELHKKAGQKDFNDILRFSSMFFDPMLLIQVIEDNFMDVLVVDLTSPLMEMRGEGELTLTAGDIKVFDKDQFESKAFSYFRSTKKFEVPEMKEGQTVEDYETSLTYELKQWIKGIEYCCDNYRFHVFKKYHLDVIEKINSNQPLLLL